MVTDVERVEVAAKPWPRGYLPCPGRQPVCRRHHCAHAATDDPLGLCSAHLADYEHRAAQTLAYASTVSVAFRNR